MLTDKYLTTLRGKYIAYVLGPNRPRIEANIARFAVLPFVLLEIYVLYYVTLC